MMKKFVLFIVEGSNDEREIQAILHTPYFKDFLSKYVPHFLTNRTDITTYSSAKKSYRGMMEKLFQDWKREGIPFQPIKNNMIQEIVHIVDVDGTFIPDNCIVEDKMAVKFQYYEDSIHASDISQAIRRNHIKAKNIMSLIDVEQLGSIPYHVYFASCNMDHLLSGERNPSRLYKDTFSFDFGKLCSADPREIFNNVLKEDYKAGTEYRESWGYIQKSFNSLQRKTNLNLFFEKYGKFEEENNG